MTLDELVGSARFTLLLGKNGSGKSTFLRSLDSSNQFSTKYISPERGGTLKYDPNVDQNMFNNEQWLINDRRKNRTEQFRQQSTAQFRNLEVLVLREIEKDKAKRQDLDYSFDHTLTRINELLPAIELRRSDRGFKIHSKSGAEIKEEQISSGEAELIALSIEVLVFSRESKTDKVLLLDEPDVHLHPDLQQKFVEFVEATSEDFDFKLVLATHSTAIVGAFSEQADLQIVPVTSKDQADFKSFSYSPICHSILPIFGVHPLSSHFNRSPVILVEGEDEQRVIEQFVRSSEGQVALSPCVVGSVDKMNEWEQWLNDYLPSIYDSPKAYSLRDLDDSPQCEIDDFGSVSRVRLNCYSIENLLLTVECLEVHGFIEDTFRTTIERWVAQEPNHPATAHLTELNQDFSARRTTKVKEIRNVLVALLGTTKPWEVVVGQLLATHAGSSGGSEHSISNYLGPQFSGKLLS